MSDDDAIVKEFLVESYENLDRLDQDLVVLEKDPANRDTLASIFRTIHTIKGTSGFLAFNRLETVTHVGENLLARLRDGLLTLNPEITSALLAMVDAVREMLKSIEETGKEGDRQDQGLIARLTGLLESQAGNVPTQPKSSETAPAPNSAVPALPTLAETPIDKSVVTASESPTSTPVPEPQSGEPHLSPERPVEKTAVKSPDAVDASSVHPQAKGQSASDSTIRVDVGQLDRLMNRVGELVLLRNQIVQYTNSTEDSELLGTSQRLNLLTTELQESVMKTRMQPIGNIWSKFPRTVRDVALGCGKQVRIEMEGKETELDKTIIEAIKDPLTHLVRNAVDHGVETPEARRAAGKNPEGLLYLRAFHEGGQVNIEVTDDGAGLDYNRLRNKAVQKALITADQAARMTEREITNLIFLPGFSTAEKVSNVSGRGVGMDVVKTNIEKIGGTVDVQSRPGQGSTIRMKIPLTLAIIPALIVTTAGDRYAIPQVSLLELVRLEGEQARKGIELVDGAPVYRLRGKLLPLVHLNRELKMDSSAAGHGVGTGVVAKDQEFDFTVARDKHRQWINTLHQVLESKLIMTADQAGSHEKCALGQWLYGTALEQYRTIREMQTLEATHKSFHELVREVLRLQEHREHARAEQELARAGQLSGKIMELLTAVEAQVREHQNINIVVLRADDRQFGLVVDEINDTEEIVVKPLSKQLKSINTYAGATIMGDGKVALILDVMGLAQRANVVGDARDRALTDKDEQAKSNAETAVGERNAVLLFQHGENGQMAIDLSLVARLEEFSRDSIETAGEHEVVQYRGQIMPLVRVSELLENRQQTSKPTAQQTLHVVVYSDQGHSVGLVVDRILDIVEESFVMQRHAGRTGVLGSAVIQKRVTDIVDVPGLIAAAKGNQLFAGTQV